MEEGLRLVSSGDEEVYVFTLGEYQDAIEKGFFAFSTYEMTMAYKCFQQPLTLLGILKTAKIAEQSFIDDPRCGLADISLLPATLLFVTEDMTSDESFSGQRKALEGKSIQDVVSSGEAKVVQVGSDLLAVENDCGRTFMFEMMRADINADGIQDMLIHWGAGPTNGTYRTACVLALTRRSQEEMLSIAPIDGLPEAG
jgi:hypothetical protein